MDASKVFKKSRTTIYESLKNGELSRDNDGLIDLSELIRVYGNPASVQSSTRTEHVHKEVPVHVHSEIETILKEQISLLKSQLDLANQREKSLMQHIEDLTHRIEFKGQLNQPNIHTEEEKSTPDETVEIKPEIAMQQPHHEPISVPLHVEPAPKKKGLLGRLAKAVFND